MAEFARNLNHPVTHFYAGLGLTAVTVVLMIAISNRALRRRLLFSLVFWLMFIGLHLAITYIRVLADYELFGQKLEVLPFALAILNTLVALAFNPWSGEGAKEHAPAIVQDALVLAFFAVAATFAFRSHAEALTTSAIAAAVVGFALQETLGNAFAGLAIQVEKPFRVGHWITVGNYEGLVTEVTWRATKIRTKAGNLVIVPNNVMAREAINNYSQPVAPTRLFVEVGADYAVPPNEVRDAIFAAMREARYLLAAPAPEVLLVDFAASAITYRARFWIDDYSKDEVAKDEVRRAIYYEFRRRSIEIPWPIQIEYSRTEKPTDSPARREGFARTIAAVPVLASLPPEAHQALAAATEERLYGNGEVIVREGEAGGSMFLVRRGRVVVTIGADRKEVAVTETGGYFGEMSLLTGQPRTATVTARGDCTVLEITADAFRAYVQSHPEVIDQLAHAAEARRHTLDEARAHTTSVPVVEAGTLAKLMRKFFGIS